MAEKKVISIENRIPKLKEARKKKANKRLIFYLLLFFLLISIIVYLQSPLSHVKHITVKGNDFVEESKIVKLSGITNQNNIWNLEFEQMEKQISNQPAIKEVSIERRLPRTVHISVEEYVRVGYVKGEGQFIPILENGKFLSDSAIDTPNGDAPILIGWEKNSTYLKEMTEELRNVKPSLAAQISEIHWDPKESNPYTIQLYMNNGQEVVASIRNFSEKIQVYPSIASQISPEQKGIVYIDVGAFFVPYDQVQEETPAESDEAEQEGENANETEG
ncbi:cell division protein DivIB [Salinibacillus aidingensis]|uniref:Cell division protein DivIB n=1 Tax=Salinibacillus aidingensis TaxID=237684 RepID=A0ABN1BCS1_9BACI